MVSEKCPTNNSIDIKNAVLPGRRRRLVEWKHSAVVFDIHSIILAEAIEQIGGDGEDVVTERAEGETVGFLGGSF